MLLQIGGHLTAGGQICTRRRVKCAAKVLVCVSLLAAYVSVLLRESLEAMETTRQRDAERRMEEAMNKLTPNRAALKVAASAAASASATAAARRFVSQRRRARNETLATAIEEASRLAMLRNVRFMRRMNARLTRVPPPESAHLLPGRSNVPRFIAPLKMKLGDSDNGGDGGNGVANIVATSVNPIYEYSAEQNAAIQADLQQRHTRLWDVCSRRDWIGKWSPNAWEFFLSPGHNLAWCNVFKAASSTWLYYFNILAGREPAFLQKTKKQPIEMARQNFPRPSVAELDEAMQSAISFLVVREPFERLLSAYRDKLEGQRNKYYSKLGAQIIRRYRKGYVRHGTGPTFKEFVQYVIDSHRLGEPADEHWRAVYEFCTPCSINYTLIAKVETFQRDTEYIIRQAGLESLLFNKMPPGANHMIANRATEDTNGVVVKYFGQLNTNLLGDLLAIYEPDFELFGYNSTKYQELVQPIEQHVVANRIETTGPTTQMTLKPN